MATAIVSIIAAIAYPSYMEHVRETNRTEAKTELMDLSQRLQRCYTSYARFDDPTNQNLCAVYEDLADGTPYLTRGGEFYEVEISDVTATTYTLTATAVKQPQISDIDGCNVMTLNHRGVRLPEVCW